MEHEDRQGDRSDGEATRFFGSFAALLSLLSRSRSDISIYENPPAWVDRPPFCFSFFPECARSTVFFTNQYLLTYGFIFRFLIPLAEDFDTWTQEVSFTRIFCMRCIQDDPSVESYFSGLPCFCDLYEWSRLVPLTAVHEPAVLAAQYPRLKISWRGSCNCRTHGALRAPRIAGAMRIRRARFSSRLWKGPGPPCDFLSVLPPSSSSPPCLLWHLVSATSNLFYCACPSPFVCPC